jgi:hypothetical protein
MRQEDLRATLWLAIEDFSGLWEVVWDMRARQTSEDDQSLIQAAREVVAELLRRGWIDLYRSQELYGELVKIEATEATRVILTPEAWQPPTKGAFSVRLGATPEGESAYNNL